MSRSINLGPAIASVMLNDRITIFRRAENVNEYGEGNEAYQQFNDVPATVYPEGQNKVDRRPEAQSTENTIGVITKFSLKTAGPGQQADVIQFGGNDYTVIVVNSYSNFGSGFMEAMAVARPTITNPGQNRPAEVAA